MLSFEFERSLFRLTLNTPAFDVLFQLPPQIGIRYSQLPKGFPSLSFILWCRLFL